MLRDNDFQTLERISGGDVITGGLDLLHLEGCGLG